MSTLRVSTVNLNSSENTKISIGTNNIDLLFTANNVDRMRVDSNGNIRVFGTINANSVLVNGVSVSGGGDYSPAFNQANLAYANANTGITYSQAAFGAVNVAYAAENTTRTWTQSSFGQSNLAYAQANSALPNTTNSSFNGKLLLIGSTSDVGTLIRSSVETSNVIAAAATGNITYHLINQPIMYLTSNATSNWNVNVAWSSTATLNSVMRIGESISFAFLAAQGATAYFSNTVFVDNALQTTRWQGGTAPTAGNAASIDTYNYTVIKTGQGTWTVLASQTQFK